MIKNDREYRYFDLNVMKRAKEEGDKPSFLVEGYASTFEEYTLGENEDYILRERIEPTAFDEADMTDVVFLLDHTGRVYARTKNKTVELSVDDKGLFTRTDLSKTEASRSVYEDIEAGNYDQMSFAFTVAEDRYEEKRAEGEKTIVTRIIDRVKKVYDISAVGFPANPTTNIGIATREAFDGAIESFEAERLKEERAKQEVARQRAIAKIKLLEVEND
ncbi:MAG: HK97 family phage prohead protease [Clostridiales bacterium]|nr:HK97 family phage prohead protease [Clostridiales bacterium]